MTQRISLKDPQRAKILRQVNVSTSKPSTTAPDYKQEFEADLITHGIAFEREVKFHPTRKWRFDYVVVGKKIGIEYQGGIEQYRPSHTSIKGIMRDYEKANEAQLAGWIILKITKQDILNQNALKMVQRAIDLAQSQTVEKGIDKIDAILTEIERHTKGVSAAFEKLESEIKKAGN